MAAPDYNFEDLTNAELRAFAGTLKVDLGKATKKSDIIAKLNAANVTWDMYKALDEVDDEPELTYNEGVGLEPGLATVVNNNEPEPVIPAQNLDPFEELLGESLADLDEPVAPEPEVVVVPVPVPVAPEEPEYRVVKLLTPSRYFEALTYVFTREHPYVLVTSDDASVLIEEFDGAFREASPREVKEFYGG